MLEEIQIWALAFEGRPHLSYVKTTYNKLKSEGNISPVAFLYLITRFPIPGSSGCDR